MNLFILFGCIFVLSALVWLPVGYWARGALARQASEAIQREVQAMLDDVHSDLDEIHGDIPRIPFQGSVQ